MKAFRHFKSYHWEWLVNHPYREPEWLAERLKDGFDVHHLDGDHENDDPDNLVLIECQDHFSIHNGVRLSRLKPRKRKDKKSSWQAADKARPDGREEYYDRAERHMQWEKIAEKHCLAVSTAIARARGYANKNVLAWPIPVPVDMEKEERKRIEKVARVAKAMAVYGSADEIKARHTPLCRKNGTGALAREFHVADCVISAIVHNKSVDWGELAAAPGWTSMYAKNGIGCDLGF